MLFRKGLKCSLRKLFIISALLFVPLCFILRGNNASAASISTINNLQSTDINISGGMTTETSTNYGTVNLPWIHQTTNVTNQWYLRNVQGRVDLGGTLTGSYFQGDVTIGINAYGTLINDYSCDGIDADLFPYGVTVRDRTVQIVSCSIDQSSTSPIHRTLYVRLRVAGSFHGSTSFTSFYFSITNTAHFLAGCGFADPYYCSSDDYWGIGSSIQAWDASEDPSLGYLSEINVSINNINNSINEYHEHEYDAVDNISDQSTSDISGATNQKTTDLIGALGSLVGAFTSIQPASDCKIQLDFPNFVGGSQIIDPCQHKEKAPQIVLIGSSVFLVLFALKYWNKMSIKIYKVIRSFIDGTDDTEGEG